MSKHFGNIRQLAGMVAMVLVLAAVAMRMSRPSMRPTVLWTEDTEIDKMTMANIKMCCSQVTFPCCTHDACCAAWLENGLDQEPAADRARPVMLVELNPRRPAYPVIE